LTTVLAKTKHPTTGLMLTLPETFKTMGCNKSLKFHFLHSQLDFSQATLKRSVMNMVEISPRYLHHRKTLPREILANRCWQLRRETPAKYNTKAAVEHFCYSVFSVGNFGLF
jgi:hypothetical protein